MHLLELVVLVAFTSLHVAEMLEVWIALNELVLGHTLQLLLLSSLISFLRSEIHFELSLKLLAFL